MRQLSNLPPGVTESMIPGNRPEDIAFERACEGVGPIHERAVALLRETVYKDWTFIVQVTEQKGCFLQIMFEAPCAKTGEKQTWFSRKWILSEHMTASEIIQTAFLAVKTAELHEIHEAFEFLGVKVFNPHFDLLAIVDSEIPEDTRDEQS